MRGNAKIVINNNSYHFESFFSFAALHQSVPLCNVFLYLKDSSTSTSLREAVHSNVTRVEANVTPVLPQAVSSSVTQETVSANYTFDFQFFLRDLPGNGDGTSGSDLTLIT